MQDKEFSQEVENSSNSTRNSRDMKILKKIIFESDEKLRFFQNANKNKKSKSIFQNSNERNNVEKTTEKTSTAEKLSRLPLVEKKDYIENWIRANEANFLEISPQKSSHGSSISPNKQEKRFADSPLSSCKGKRRRSQNSDLTDNFKLRTKENYGFKSVHRKGDEALLENSRGDPESNSSTLYPANKPRRIFRPQASPRDANLVIWKARNSEILAPSSPVVADSKVRRYSWHERNPTSKKILELSRNWREILGQPSSTKIGEESPLRWSGYDSPTSTSELERCSQGQERSLSRNLCLLRESNWRKLSPESPLRWKGYEIQDSSPSSSIVFRTKQGQGRASPKDIIYSPTTSRNSMRNGNKILPDSETESPLRFVGYQPQIRDVQKLAPSQTLSSPMNEAERIINPSSSSESDEILILEDENSSGEGSCRKSGRKRKRRHFEAETPQRWSGGKFMEFCKLPQVSLPITDVEPAGLIPPTPDQEQIVLDLESEKSSRNFRLTRKTRPVKLETIFGSENEQILISTCADLPETRAVSTAMPETESIEVKSLSAVEEEPKIDVESETGSDRTIGNNIEDVLTQNASPRSRQSPIPIHRGKRTLTPQNIDLEDADSDATYFSDGEPDRNAARADNSPEYPRITRDLSTFSINKDELISQASSPKLNEEEITISVPTIPPPRNTSKRTKKAKQGSLAARLQYLVNFQISDRQIWRYRKTRADWQDSRAQFVKLRIQEGEIRYSRCFLLASPIEDEHKLLDDLYAPGEERVSDEETITLMIVPEINGTMKISKNSIMKIYPPWKIMDRGKKLLNIIYFEVLAQNDKSKFDHPRLINGERIVQTFDCPCLRNRAIDQSCTVKFTNTKPNVIRDMFSESK